LTREDPPAGLSRSRLLGTAFAIEGALLLIAWGLGWAMNVSPFASARLALSDLVIGTAAGALLLVPMAAIARSGWPPFERLARVARLLATTLFARATVLDLALVSLLAGVAEEALFRGVVQAGLAPAIGVGPAIALGAALFGLAHLVTPTYAVVAAVIGLLFGVLLASTGNLMVPVTAHAVYDFLALIVLVKRGALDAPPAENG